MWFGYLVLKEQPLLRPAGRTIYCSHQVIDKAFTSLHKASAWFHINFLLAHTSAFWGWDGILQHQEAQPIDQNLEIMPSDSDPRFIVFLVIETHIILVTNLHVAYHDSMSGFWNKMS